MSSRAFEFSQEVAAANFGISNADLKIGTITVADLAAEYGTPLYAYDASLIRRNFERLSQAVAPASILYSIKANPNPAIASLLVDRGADVEVASPGEFRLACRAGANPGRIVAAGPGKTKEDLEYFVENEIGEIHVESFEEIESLGVI